MLALCTAECAGTASPEASRTRAGDRPRTRGASAPPSTHRRALLTWIAVYAAITAVQLAIGHRADGLPVPVRTLLLTLVVVPLVVYLLVPGLLRLNAALTRLASATRERLGGRR